MKQCFSELLENYVLSDFPFIFLPCDVRDINGELGSK